jgi:Tfp pilus assembly protein PilX
MKIHAFIRERGSVLIIALLTITILTLICATSLHVTSQNATAGMEVSSWQQALTAAESGIDAAVRALNDDSQGYSNNAWTHWVSVNQTVTSGTYGLPTTEPTTSSSPTASAAPKPSPGATYNYLPSTQLTVTFPGSSEGATTVSAWVTIDTAGLDKTKDTNGKQWYRIRAAGSANLSGPTRVSNNRLDNDLRNTVALRFNRKTGSSTNLGPTRTLEVIMQPLSQNGWARGITLKSWISMGGGTSVVDSYDSSNSAKSTNHLYDSTKRQSHGDIGSLNSAGSSDLRSSYVYGSLSYSGSTVKNTTHVQGTISSPFSVAIPQPTPPTGWPSLPAGNIFTGGGSNPPNGGVFNSGNGPGAGKYYKINGDLTVSSSGQPMHLVQQDTSGNDEIYIWVTGKLTTSGSGYINQDQYVHVYWYVGGDITLSGQSFQNHTGLAANNTIVGYGTNNKLTISGSSDFIGTFNTPGYATTISGGGSVAGALIANNLTISGGSGLHYDEALGGGGGSLAVGNFAYASWFEDNAIPNHKDQNGNYVIY